MVQALLKRSVSFVPWRWRGTIKRLPLVAPLQRWLLARFLEEREFIHTVDAGPGRGLRIPICLPEDKEIWTGKDEMVLSTALRRVIREGHACVDIGGWHGFFAGVMALAGARKVYVFDPLPDNCSRIRRLIELNPSLPLQLFQAAVADKSGDAEFCVTGSSDTGKLVALSIPQHLESERRIQVRVHTLDELVAAGVIEAPGLIKVDVEGAELMVLKGASTLLARSKPRLFIEIHSRSLARECYDLLRSHGYEVCVLETRHPPDFSTEPQICHFAAFHGNSTTYPHPRLSLG